MMNAVVCTLFEGNYHYGLAALTNSLCKNGFAGDVYAGYRGTLPGWSSNAKTNADLDWPGALTLDVNDEVRLHFLPLETDYHLTNYKPAFMLRLRQGPAKDADGIVYFDPDIIIKCRWSFFEDWMNHGVALVHEITSNDMPPSHPIRLEWEKVIKKAGRQILRTPHSYINAGFCGVSKQHYEFLTVWAEVIDVAIKDHKPDPRKFMTFDRTYPFYSIDQDALNVTAMCAKPPISEIGPEGMDFIQGGWLMSHAVGSPKPWQKNFIRSAFKGNVPSMADKSYWLNVEAPINLYSKPGTLVKKASILCAAFTGRFYRKY